MDGNPDNQQILWILGRIQGELVGIRNELRSELDEIAKLSQRVSAMEHWQTWLKSAWTILTVAYGFILRALHGR